jgi:hypothetical protein
MRFFKSSKAGWDTAWKEYEAHVRSILSALPENARELAGISFHNAQIKSVKHLSKKAVEIVVEAEGFNFLEERYLKYGTYTLSFSGVKKAWAPYSIVGSYLSCAEMRLSDIAAFDYEVSLSNGGIRIQADDVLFTPGLCK